MGNFISRTNYHPGIISARECVNESYIHRYDPSGSSPHMPVFNSAMPCTNEQYEFASDRLFINVPEGEEWLVLLTLKTNLTMREGTDYGNLNARLWVNYYPVENQPPTVRKYISPFFVARDLKDIGWVLIKTVQRCGSGKHEFYPELADNVTGSIPEGYYVGMSYINGDYTTATSGVMSAEILERKKA